MLYQLVIVPQDSFTLLPFQKCMCLVKQLALNIKLLTMKVIANVSKICF